MANIPVERTGGAGIWPWLIGLLALLLVGWFVLELFDDEPDADEIAGVENNVGPIDDVELDAPGLNDGSITVLDPLYEDYGTGTYAAGAAGTAGGDGAMDADATVGADAANGAMGADGTMAGDTRIGQTVSLTNVPVLSVVSDSAFFVGTDDNRRVLVVLENLGESETGAGGSDGAFNVDQGETVSINGTVARYAEGARGTWDLPQADRDRMLRRGLYVKANSRADVTMGGAGG